MSTIRLRLLCSTAALITVTTSFAFGLAEPAAAAGSRSAGATTWYVDATGNDGRDGRSAGTAWRTIDRANVAAHAGDTVFLRGQFTAQAIAPRNSGTSASPITYRALSPGAAVIVGNGPVDATNPSSLRYEAYFGARSYVIVDGVSFTNPDYAAHPLVYDGVRILLSDHITITRCSFEHVPVVIEHSNDNVVESSTFRSYVSSYVNPATGAVDANHGMTAGDFLRILGGSARNAIRKNDMRYAGHSLIEVGSGRNDAPNPGNVISDNVLSNPWYVPVMLANDGAGTVIEGNVIEDASSQPALYSTVCCAQNTLSVSSSAMQIIGTNYIVRNNTFTNNVAQRGVITLGAWWYVDSLSPSGIFAQAQGNQIYNNTVYANHGAAGVSFVVFYGDDDAAAGRPQPQLTNNLIANNLFYANTGSSASYWGGAAYNDILYYSVTRANAWAAGSFGGNEIISNAFQAPTANDTVLAYTMSDGRSQARTSYSLAQFQSAFGGAVRNNVAVNPQVNAVTLDPLPRSPLIDHGAIIPGAPAFIGRGPDIGRFEYGQAAKTATVHQASTVHVSRPTRGL